MWSVLSISPTLGEKPGQRGVGSKHGKDLLPAAQGEQPSGFGSQGPKHRAANEEMLHGEADPPSMIRRKKRG